MTIQSNDEQVFTINTTATKFVVKCKGHELEIDFAKMHPSWVEHFLMKAAQRRINDDLSGYEANEKLAEYRHILTKVHSGEPLEKAKRATGGVRASGDPVKDLAFRNAKQDLLAKFKAATGLGKIADMIAASAVIAGAFTEKGAWREESVQGYIAKQLADGGIDYVANATATLATSAGGDDDETVDVLAGLF